jgi:hypothetical protein
LSATKNKQIEKTWKDTTIDFGKYKGKTIDQIRHVDFKYCIWAKNELNGAIREQFEQAVEHQYKIDPFSSGNEIDKYERKGRVVV